MSSWAASFVWMPADAALSPPSTARSSSLIAAPPATAPPPAGSCPIAVSDVCSDLTSVCTWETRSTICWLGFSARAEMVATDSTTCAEACTCRRVVSGTMHSGHVATGERHTSSRAARISWCALR